MSREQKGGHESPFPGLDVPGPPEVLEESVLGKAREALARDPVPDCWTRIWESRPARLAWSACVMGLIAANVAVGSWKRSPGDPSPVVADQAPSSAEEEIIELGRLPRLDVGLLADERTARPVLPGQSAPATPDPEEQS
jgi:hypothetical protein